MYHVLVAEDEHWIRGGIVEMVERIGGGFKVAGEAGDGEEAWNLIHELCPTVLITDIMMPKLDGLSLIKRLDDIQFPIMSIIISGYDNFSYAQQGIRYGVSEYLLKPVREEALKEALDRSIARLERLYPLHEQLMAIQSFVDRMQTMEAKQLMSEQSQLVQAILKSRHGHPSSRLGLLRILAGKLQDALTYSYPEAERPAGDDNTEESARRQVQQLAEQWCRLGQDPQSKRSFRLVIRQACEYAEKSYMREISLSEIADYAGLSVSHFSALFKQYSGDSFINYMNRLRIDKAKQLLLEPDLKIYQVADMVGFSSMPYFNRVFKNLTGLSPNEFRKGMGI
ncbi:two-component system, response regulator YesN [Paenibacillus sp. UNCCL117]|uniref:response regulator transcription factor n=1 Tax=unclassified Paenibacillus TaxID=185978 RepID=UPI0008827FB2|nr:MULTISPECIES: helix-turn-helix domain-containing protein [unclassified Paenibacillus]SDE20586.1 two-component system, response regulator YesN [Paenibacillus sp. cl123]SFW61678.1 two-component system, response regulator YesN [Paenibacillus sp. UNCCL117]